MSSHTTILALLGTPSFRVNLLKQSGVWLSISLKLRLEFKPLFLLIGILGCLFCPFSHMLVVMKAYLCNRLQYAAFFEMLKQSLVAIHFQLFRSVSVCEGYWGCL